MNFRNKFIDVTTFKPKEFNSKQNLKQLKRTEFDLMIIRDSIHSFIHSLNSNEFKIYNNLKQFKTI